MNRCTWANVNTLMQTYHDIEWGVPLYNDTKHFEMLLLETHQAGLSWNCILSKRESFRHSFAEFNPEKVARFTPAKIEKLLQNPAIIRNRQKITSTIKNAAIFLKVAEKYGSFSNFMWDFVDGKPIINRWANQEQIPVSTALSDTIAKTMKYLGFAFVGTTTMYAHAQAIGLVNDHLQNCFRWKALGGK